MDGCGTAVMCFGKAAARFAEESGGTAWLGHGEAMASNVGGGNAELGKGLLRH